MTILWIIITFSSFSDVTVAASDDVADAPESTLAVMSLEDDDDADDATWFI